jgi:hypothetical protein
VLFVKFWVVDCCCYSTATLAGDSWAHECASTGGCPAHNLGLRPARRLSSVMK